MKKLSTLIVASIIFSFSAVAGAICPVKEIPLQYEGGCTTITTPQGEPVLIPPAMKEGEEEMGGCLFSFSYEEEKEITFQIPHFGRINLCIDNECRETDSSGFLSFDFTRSTDFPLLNEKDRAEVRIFLESEAGAISPPKAYTEDCSCEGSGLGCPIDPPQP